ncbi:MAG TPA: hypothetical protein PKC21_06415 [Oligoflexia bacterium]|nr:hypothetical protein [Oligoflexia bacterium]
MRVFEQMLMDQLYYVYDGVHATELDDEEIFAVKDKISINLKREKTAEDFLRLMDKAWSCAQDDMIRFVFSYDYHVQQRRLPPVLDIHQYYAWYGCGRLKHTVFPEQANMTNQVLNKIKFKKVHRLGDPEKEFLIQKWQEQYIDTVLKDYPLQVKQQQLEKFMKGLEFYAEKTQYLFYKNDVIVGHYSMHIFDWPPFGGKALDPHRWIEQSLPKEERKIIHAHITQILKDNEQYAMGAGVVLNNEKSLNILQQNGFIPLHLCVKSLIA